MSQTLFLIRETQKYVILIKFKLKKNRIKK